MNKTESGGNRPVMTKSQVMSHVGTAAMEKSVIINLRPRSAQSETLAPDGEVANYKGIPFLDDMIAEITQGSGSNSGNGSGGSGNGSGNSASSPVYTLTPEFVATGVNLPARSRLIAVHTPSSTKVTFDDEGEDLLTYYIALQPNGALCSVDGAGISAHIAFWPDGELGVLRRAWASADMVHILGENGIAWLLFDPATGRYHFQRELPAPPSVSFTMEAAHLPGYTMVAGNRPKLSLSVAMPDSDEVSQIAVANWLSGISYALPEAAAERIYKAVGEAIEEYEAAAMRAGCFLTPVTGMASFGEVLPSLPSLSAESAVEVRAFIDSADYHAGRVNLEVSLTMMPFQLAVEVELTDNQRLWSSVFGALRIHLAKNKGWFGSKSDMTPSGVSTAVDVDGKRHPCFILRPKSAEQVMLELKDNDSFYTVYETAVAGLTGGIGRIAAVLRPAGSGSTLFTPHYEDEQRLCPTGALLTDDGLLLWGGKGEFRDSKGDLHSVPLSNALLAPMPGNGVIYREVTRIGSSRLHAVALAGSVKSASALRHPLVAFSGDGIRLLSSATGSDILGGEAALWRHDVSIGDGQSAKGQYRITRYLSPDVLASGRHPQGCGSVFHGDLESDLVAVGEGQVYYITDRGIRRIAGGTSLSNLHLWQESGVKEEDVSVRREMPRQMVYDPASGNLLLKFSYGIEVLEAEGGRLHLQSEMVVGNILVFNGHLLASSELGEVGVLKILRENTLDSDEEDEDGASGEKRVKLRASQSVYKSVLTTRALKLGDCFAAKRIRGVDAGIGDINIVLEGSDTATHWHTIAQGRSPLKAIHAPAFRFHRLRISLAEESLPYFRQVKITYNYVIFAKNS